MIISHSLRARLRKGSRPWAFYGAEGLLTNEGHLAIIKLNNRMHWTGFGLDGKYWKLQKCENVHFWSTKKHRKCIEMATKWRWNAIYEIKHKSVGIQQNATESVGWAVCVRKDTDGFVIGRRNFSGCRIRERSALDNPRADVYNKDKERRCPCKRLAPHRHMVKKNDRHRLETVGGHFFLSLLPLSCEIRHAMSKVTCTTWANNISRLTMRARSAKTSARVMWHPPFTRWASGGKLQKAPSHTHFVPKNDVAKPGGA